MAIQVSCRYGKECSQNKTVQFSVVELLNQIKSNPQSLFSEPDKLQLEDVEEALLYLSKIGALKLEGGFLILYNAMNIQRIRITNQDINKTTTGCLTNSTSKNPASTYCRGIRQFDGKGL